MARLFARLTRLPAGLHALALVLALGGAVWLARMVDALYVASGHPASHASGQLAFSAARIEVYFAVMQSAGTLERYAASQRLDLGLIVAIALVVLLAGSFAARLGGPGSRGWQAGLAAAWLGLAGAGMDVAENLASFAMLAPPVSIPQALALAYSSFAAAKFALLALALLALLAAVLIGAVERLDGAYRPR